MQKVGIMTFHRAENYGAFLQAYSLSMFIDHSFPADAYLVDYINPKIEDSYKPSVILKSSRNPIKALLRYALSYYDIKKRNYTFSQDRKKYLKIVQADVTKEQLKEVLKQYDIVITGSDQVWNLKITGDDYSYMLEDVSSEVLKVAYAAGVSMSEKELQSSPKILGLAQDMDRLAFRESTTSSIFKKLLPKKEIYTVIDPVFLQTADFWREKAPEITYKDYILVFVAGKSPQTRNLIDAGKRMAREMSKPVFFLSNDSYWYEYRDVEHAGAVSPMAFVRWIDNAYCVITNSFHATAFSLILHTNVYSEVNIKRADRLENLLNMCGLPERMIYDGEILNNQNISDVLWEQVDAAINEECKVAMSYLETLFIK